MFPPLLVLTVPDAIVIAPSKPSTSTVPPVVAAFTLRPGAKLDPVALRRVVCRNLPAAERPMVVRVVADLPMTAGHRTRKRALRREGLGLDDAAGETWWLAPDEEGYVPLSSDDLDRLLASI